MEQLPHRNDRKIKQELDAMEASQILDMNRRPDSDCSYSPRPIHKKRSRAGLCIGLGISAMLVVGVIVAFAMFDISLERIDGGYSLQVQRRGHRAEEETAAPGEVDLPDEGLASGQFSISPYPMANSTAEPTTMSLQDI